MKVIARANGEPIPTFAEFRARQAEQEAAEFQARGTGQEASAAME